MMNLEPIGVFHCLEKYSYDVPRQGILAGSNRGVISLKRGCGFEQALVGLESFSHIWILFEFNQADGWKPMVRPPRHTERKVGVFATRAPYRPNRIGMSCVELCSIHGLDIEVTGHDILDGTPVLDIKPYLPYADAFPDASPGWTAQTETQYPVEYSQEAAEQIAWLAERGVPCMKAFIEDRLGTDPLNARRNRFVDGKLAYRTWRISFSLQRGSVLVDAVTTGYSAAELSVEEDKYGDKAVHRQFMLRWQIE